MTEEDEEKPKGPLAADVLGMLLDGWSVEELHDYVTRLEMEIERAKAVIADKQGAQSAAESIFKKG